MAEWFRLDALEMDKLQDAINRSTQLAGPVIDAVLRGVGERCHACTLQAGKRDALSHDRGKRQISLSVFP